jgi:hypothetical protein
MELSEFYHEESRGTPFIFDEIDPPLGAIRR